MDAGLNRGPGKGEWSFFSTEGRWMGTVVVPVLDVDRIGENFIPVGTCTPIRKSSLWSATG